MRKEILGFIYFEKNGEDECWCVSASHLDTPESLKTHFEKWVKDAEFIGAEILHYSCIK